VQSRLRELLAGIPKKSIIDANRVPSAVLVPLYIKQGQYHIVFIKRTQIVTTHKGQISFPGGSRETDDKTLLDTAIREAFEEIGLSPESVEVLGELDDELTLTSRFIVTPFVASIPWPYQFVKNKYEVDEIIKVPVTALLNTEGRQFDFKLPEGEPFDPCAYYYQGERIWGATARILNKLLDVFIKAGLVGGD